MTKRSKEILSWEKLPVLKLFEPLDYDWTDDPFEIFMTTLNKPFLLDVDIYRALEKLFIKASGIEELEDAFQNVREGLQIVSGSAVDLNNNPTDSLSNYRDSSMTTTSHESISGGLMIDLEKAEEKLSLESKKKLFEANEATSIIKMIPESGISTDNGRLIATTKMTNSSASNVHDEINRETPHVSLSGNINDKEETVQNILEQREAGVNKETLLAIPLIPAEGSISEANIIQSSLVNADLETINFQIEDINQEIQKKDIPTVLETDAATKNIRRESLEEKKIQVEDYFDLHSFEYSALVNKKKEILSDALGLLLQQNLNPSMIEEISQRFCEHKGQIKAHIPDEDPLIQQIIDTGHMNVREINIDYLLVDLEPNMDVNISSLLERPPALADGKIKKFDALKLKDPRINYRTQFVPFDRKSRNSHNNPFNTAFGAYYDAQIYHRKG